MAERPLADDERRDFDIRIRRQFREYLGIQEKTSLTFDATDGRGSCRSTSGAKLLQGQAASAAVRATANPSELGDLLWLRAKPLS